jgi:hypothetical protein
MVLLIGCKPQKHCTNKLLKKCERALSTCLPGHFNSTCNWYVSFDFSAALHF